MPTEAVLREHIERFLRKTVRRRDEVWWQRHLSALRRHWREGLLAAAVTLGLWLHTVPGSDLDRSSKAIPVVVENLPEGFTVLGVEPPEVEVVFEGRRRDLVMARGGALLVRVDGDLARLGRRTFKLEAEQVEHPEALEVVAIAPGKVRLELAQEVAQQ